MKECLTVFHQNLELRAVRKIRLRYSESEFHAGVYHMSMRAFITLRSLRPKFETSGGFESRRSHICIQKGYYTTEYTRPVATGGIVKTIFPHNFPKNDAQDLKKWSRKTRPVFLYNL